VIGPGGLASAAIPNGSFENGADGAWREQSSQYSQQQGSLIVSPESVNAVPLRFSAFIARLGGTHNESSTLAQTIELPDSPELYLAFDYTIRSNDLCGYDKTTIYLNGRNIATYNLCIENESQQWLPEMIDISQYAGESAVLQFNVQTDHQLVSSFMLDNLELHQSTPEPTGATIPPTESELDWSIQTAPGQHGVILDWDVYPDMDVVQYRIQRRADNASTSWETIAQTQETFYYDDFLADKNGPNAPEKSANASTAADSYCYRIRALRENTRAVLTYSTSCVGVGETQLWTPLLFGKPESEITLPIHIMNSNGLQITDGEIELEFDPMVLQVLHVEPSILTQNYTVAHTLQENPAQFQRLQVRLQPKESARSVPLIGRGPLFWIKFQIIGQHGKKSKLDILDFNLNQTKAAEKGAKLTAAFPYILEQQLGGILVQKNAEFIAGDVNGDAHVNRQDASQTLKVALGREQADRFQSSAADLNGDITVDVSDAAAMLYYTEYGTWPHLVEQSEDKAQVASATHQAAYPATHPTTMTVALMDVLYAPNQQTDNPLVVTTLSAENLPAITAGYFTILYDPTALSRVRDVIADNLLLENHFSAC